MNPNHPPRLPATRTAWLVAAIGAGVFGLAALLAHTGQNAIDQRVFLFFNDVPGWLADVLTPVAKLFLPLGLFVVIVAAGAFVTIRHRSGVPLAAGASAAAVAYVLANLAKAVAQRPRPYEVLTDAVLRQPPAHGTSFPSSHVSVAVATVIALLPFLPRRLAPWAIVYAALVGWSRMFLGVHFPLDVLGGAGVGLFVGGCTLVVLGLVLRPRGPAPPQASEPADERPG